MAAEVLFDTRISEPISNDLKIIGSNGTAPAV